MRTRAPVVANLVLFDIALILTLHFDNNRLNLYLFPPHRQLLSDVVSNLSTKMNDDAVSKAVSHYTLEVVQPRVISFEDQARVEVC